ncbi:MAG: hypothetical protein ACYDEX_10885 [Mobilitalea sp.]
MFANTDGMIRINMNYQEIQGETLRALLDFCFSNSDTISLSQDHNIGMTKEEADFAITKYNEYLIKNDMTQGLAPSEKETLDFYKNIAETEEELKEMIQRDKESREKYKSYFKKTKEEVSRYLKDAFTEYHLIDRDVTCMTPCTYGGPRVMYFFKIEENIMKQFYDRNDLYEPVVTNEVEELRLDDPTFYKEGKILMLVCSHEQHASLFLSEAQYNDFRKLNVPHD